MLLIYNIGVLLYYIIIKSASLFNKKAALWIRGRNNQTIKKFEKSIWFHFASLGEFEQGRPVLEQLRKRYPEKKIIITFFSPSGYEIRKNTPLADAVYYLPVDTANNAQAFIESIDPELAVFTKYEYWYHYFNELNKNSVPLYVISSIFRKDQVFFKWYGSLHRKMLTMVTHFFVQDDNSKQLLASLNLNNVTISGDTRFDRVWDNAMQPKPLPVIAEFKGNNKVFVAGSTWPPDEKLIAPLINQYPDWKFIFAPHEIGPEKIKGLEETLNGCEVIKFSEIIGEQTPLNKYQVLIIDNIGMLSSLYQYGEVAYIGGGFGAGIHNTLEAAAFGLPVIFGPKYEKFKEARDLVALKAGFSINTPEELAKAAQLIMADVEYHAFASEKIRQYVKDNTGATGKIISHISTV